MRPYPRMLLPHPYGITIHVDAGLGDDCIVYQNVTIGNSDGRSRPPIIGDRVVVGANSVLLGPITVGKDAIIGAGSVVTKDVPAGAVVAGNPARVVSWVFKTVED